MRSIAFSPTCPSKRPTMPETARQNTLVSIVFDRPTERLSEMASFVEAIQQRYAFFEILVGVEDGVPPERWAALSTHIRALVLDRRLSRHMRRAALCRASIGDLIVCLPREGWHADAACALLAAAEERGSAFLRTHPKRWFDHPLTYLGKASQLVVDSGVSPAIAFSRATMEHALVREDQALALRFPPPQAAIVPPQPGHTPMRDKGIRDRAALVHSLAINTAPMLLTMGFWASIAATIVGLFACVYAIAVYLFASQVAEGWTTTTLLLSGVTVWGGAMGAALSAALARLMPQQRHTQQGSVVQEVGHNDLLQSLRAQHNLVRSDKEHL